MGKITVNMVSESEFGIKAHGVHTAHREMVKALQARDDVEVVVNGNGPADVLHVQTMGPYVIRKLLSRKYKAKVVSVHVVPASLVGSLRGARLWSPLAWPYLRAVYGMGDVMLACSRNVAEDLGRMRLKGYQTFYNSIDMSEYATSPEERAAARAALGIGKDEFVVVGNGQVQPRKRVDVLADYARANPEVRVFWVGGITFKKLGAEYSDMNELIETVPQNMTVTGVIDIADVKQYYQAADAFVLPSEQENHPMCVLEAAGAGLPIVLRDIPNYEDTFGTDVLLAGSDEEFGTLIDRLRAEPHLRAEYAAGSGRIAERFDSGAAAERLVTLYRKLLAGR
ncbi:MAG TPA: glycosyltransferase family 4 protein [Actinomycetales bacterium]|nr:glycosyltransferase family 4 protein [Actinomycetales bacterium]